MGMQPDMWVRGWERTRASVLQGCMVFLESVQSVLVSRSNYLLLSPYSATNRTA